MINQQLSIVFVSIAFALTACGGGGGSQKDSNGAELQGEWEAACEAATQQLFAQSSFKFSGSEFDQTVTLSTDQSCTNVALIATTSGVFADGKSTEISGRGTEVEVDVTFQSQTETWFLQGDIDNFNEDSRCGISNWSAGVEFDVSNCDDAVGRIPVPQTRFGLYMVSGDDLFLTSDLSPTPETRPTELSSTPDYTRR